MRFRPVDMRKGPRAASSENYGRRSAQGKSCDAERALESNRRASRILALRRASMVSRPSRFVFVVAPMLSIAAGRAGAQDSRQLFEAGKYQAAIDKSAGDGSPATLYLKGLSYVKLNQPAAAKEAFGQIGGDEAWQAVGQSAIAL